MSDKQKTKTVCFRVPEDLIKEIERDAKTNLTSTNVLINQILFRYVVWDRYKERMRMLPVPEDALVHYVEGLDESEMNEAVEIAFNALRDFVLVSKKKFDLHSCFEVLENYCRAANISVEDNISVGMHSFVIRHNLNKKVSSFIIKLAEKIFWDLQKIRVNSQSTKTTVIITPDGKIN